MRMPVLPTMLACLVSAIGIAMFYGVPLENLAKTMTTGYKAPTGLAGPDTPAPRGVNEHYAHGAAAVFRRGVWGILERAKVLAVLLDAML